MVPVTRFTSLASVEAWDRLYRWRQDGLVRDATIDATWRRIADAVATAEGALAPLWAHRFVTACSRWQVLPGEPLLACAGTDHGPDAWTPAAAINLSGFVADDVFGVPRLDRARLVEAAALATRLLDDAMMVYPNTQGDGPRVSLIGVADALRMLELPYGSDAAQDLVAIAAAQVAEGCLRANIDLATERGPMDGLAGGDAWRETLVRRRMPGPLIEEAARQGVRHLRITALDAHPALACLANDVADSLEPMPEDATRRYDAQGHCVRIARERLVDAVRAYVDRPLPADDARNHGVRAATMGGAPGQDAVASACS